MPLPSDHPFAAFNDYFYLESGSKPMPIYIWKKGNEGVLVELYLNDFINGPRARVYSVLFDDEYYFELNKNIRNITRKATDDLLEATAEYVKGVLNSL